MSKTKEYIYIVQSSIEPAKCKIGKTNNFERRLKEYNSITGISKDNQYKYLYVCEVKDMSLLENAIKKQFSIMREESNKEIYFYNKPLFDQYVEFIKAKDGYIKEVYIKEKKQKEIVKIVQKTKPTLKEKGLSKESLLKKARRADNDEFYTRYEDVIKELSMYDKNIWKNKVVFCNCDDAVGDPSGKDENRTSAFAVYFIRNFKVLGLKKLICTHYANPQLDLFDAGAKGYIFTKYGFKEIECDYNEKIRSYDGSFDHSESIRILNEEADIVCTNPPFSRAIDYWDMLIKSKKLFIIISGETNVITKAFIKYFKDKKVWPGYNDLRWFLTPKKELTRAAAFWYTNIEINNRPKYKNLKIIPLKEIPDKYKKYDDKKVLLVDYCYIPNDHKKPFAISTTPILSGILEKGYELVNNEQYIPHINKKAKFARVLIQKI